MAERSSCRVLVAGCGAIGSVFACMLARAGHDVSVLGRPAHMSAVTSAGLWVEGIWGSHHTRAIKAASGPEQLEGDYDAVLVTCKSFQTATVAEAVGERLGHGGLAISLQNGLGNTEQLGAVFGAERVLAGRVIFGAELAAPGRVRVTVEAEPVLIGRPQGGRDRLAEQWAERIDQAGITCRATSAILAALWGKVFYNAALNPMGALLGLPYGELAADPERRRLMNRIIEEAFAVAVAEGVDLPWGSARVYLDTFYGHLLPSTASHRSSMLHDIERGRPTEIAAICGEICRRGQIHGIDVTLNRALSVLVEGRSTCSRAVRGGAN